MESSTPVQSNGIVPAIVIPTDPGPSPSQTDTSNLEHSSHNLEHSSQANEQPINTSSKYFIILEMLGNILPWFPWLPWFRKR